MLVFIEVEGIGSIKQAIERVWGVAIFFAQQFLLRSRDFRGDINISSDFSGEPLILIFWASWSPLEADQSKILGEYLTKEDKPFFSIVTVNNQEGRGIVEIFASSGRCKVKNSSR